MYGLHLEFVVFKKNTWAFPSSQKRHHYCRAEFLAIGMSLQFELGIVNVNCNRNEISCILTPECVLWGL